MGRRNEPRAALRETRQNRIEAIRDEAGEEGAEVGRESRDDPGERVPSRDEEQRAAHRDDEDRRRVGQEVAEDGSDSDQRGQQPGRRDRQHSAQGPGNEPRSFRHAHANHHHQHHAQGREGDERLDRA